MLSVKVLGDWCTLDTINGYYRLDDLWKESGKPEGLDPVSFSRDHGPHEIYSIRRNKYVWATQAKVYEYAAFLDEEFKALWEEAKDLRDVSLLRNVATGVIHK